MLRSSHKWTPLSYKCSFQGTKEHICTFVKRLTSNCVHWGHVLIVEHMQDWKYVFQTQVMSVSTLRSLVLNLCCFCFLSNLRLYTLNSVEKPMLVWYLLCLCVKQSVTWNYWLSNGKLPWVCVFHWQLHPLHNSDIFRVFQTVTVCLTS